MIIDKGNKMALVSKTGQKVNVRLEVNPKARRLILRLDEKNREAVAVAPRARKISEAAAFAHVESIIWADGTVCPHCGCVDRAYRLEGVRLTWTRPPSARCSFSFNCARVG